MLQATRTANRKGRQKKKQQAQLQTHDHHGPSQPRKSVRYPGYNRNGKKSQPHSPYHHTHFNTKRNKRKSTIFHPTHVGQSAVAMVEHSVFQQINNPTLPGQKKYQQYKQIKRRQSLTARKKKEEDMIRKTVAMNAQQHQQLLNMVKHQTYESPVPISKPSSPHYNDGLPLPNNDSWIDRAKSHRMAPNKINITNVENVNKSRIGSTVVTPINKNTFVRSKSTRGSSIGDALGFSKNELDEYKSQIMNSKNDKRNSMSFQSQQSVHNQNIQANQLFTTPHSVASRRQSLRLGVNNNNNTNNNAIVQMILMVFQSLPMQQKKELMHLMSLQLMQQNVPNLVQQQSKSNLPKALSNATNKANFLEQLKEPLMASKSIPIKESPTLTNNVSNKSLNLFSQVARSHKTDRSKSLTNTPKAKSQTSLLKDRVHKSTPKLPLMIDNDHDELFEIKESQSLEQNKHKNNHNNKSNISWKPTEHIKLPTATPNMQIGGVLSTIQSQYDFDDVNVDALTPKSMDSEENQDSDVEIELSNDMDIDHKIDIQLFDHIAVPVLDKKAAGLSKKQRTVHFKEEKEELTHNDSVSSTLQNAMEIMQPLFEQDLEEEKKQILLSTDIGMTPLLHNQASINSMENSLGKDLTNDSVPPSPTKTPNIPTRIDKKVSTSVSSPKELLLTHRLSKTVKDTSVDEPDNDEKEPRERISSADLFAKDIIDVMFEEDIENVNSTDRTRTPLQILDSSEAELSGGNSSTMTEEQGSEHYIVRLHPSRYQQNKLMDHESLQFSATSGESDAVDPDVEETTQRIGVPAPLQSHALMNASMMNIGIDPDGDDGDTDDEAPNYFGAGTPLAVREGTETIQKTLRAVWVRGHTRIGTLIHFILIIINCVAAVMFVAAIEGYENEGLEYFFTSAFLVDFCVRLYAAKSAFLYLRSAKGIADFVSVMPGIILAISDFDASVPLWTFSFVRAMRVLRILRLLAHMVNVEDVQQEELHDPIDIDAREFMDQLTGEENAKNSGGCCNKKFWIMSKVTYFKLTLVSYLLMVVFVGAGLFACVEGPQSEIQTVSSFFESFYFIVVTITTVGYGDYSPVTNIGQICIILVISVAFIVVPYRASVLAELEFKFADQESELSVMDAINLEDLRADAESDFEDEGPETFLGYCANCAGPRWTIGTQEMPISCMHCFHPVLTPEQVQEWFPDIADALAEFVTNERRELLSLMLDAKEGADNGMLPMFQEMVRNNGNPNIPFIHSQPGSMHAQTNPFGSLYATPTAITNQYPSFDPQLLMTDTFAANNYHNMNNMNNNMNNMNNNMNNMNNNMNHLSAMKSTDTYTSVDDNTSISKLSHDHEHNPLNLLKNERNISVDPIVEEPTELQMESPIDLPDDKNKKFSNLNKLNLLSTYSFENEKSPKSKSKSKLRIPVGTPSMEESETLSGYDRQSSDSNSNSDEELGTELYITPEPNSNINIDANIALFKADIDMPTPHNPTPHVATPTPTTSNKINKINKSHHSRQPTPAEVPGAQQIKKFSLKLLDSDIKAFDEEDFEEESDDSMDSYNDSMDKEEEKEEAEEKAQNPQYRKAKSSGDVLKIKQQKSKTTLKNKKTKKKVQKKSETPKAVSSSLTNKNNNNKNKRGGSFNDYHYNLTLNGSSSDDDDIILSPRNKFPGLSIIIDAPNGKDRAVTTRTAADSIRRSFNMNNNEKFDEDDEDEMNQIIPQEYEQLSLFFDKMDKANEYKNKNKIKNNEKRASMDDARRQKRAKTSRHHEDNNKIKQSRHKAHNSAHLYNNNNNNNNKMVSAFIQNQTIAKSMTNLFLANQMNQQEKKGSANPMKEYHTNKVLAQLETHFGSSSNLQNSNSNTLTPSFNQNNNKKMKKKKGKKKKRRKT